MSGSKEINSKIKSVKNTRKVTKALEMVSASKIRKAQDQMAASRPYARMMHKLSGHIARANPEYTHPLMQEREQTQNVGYLIISTDRGLCGGLNSNLFKHAMSSMNEWLEKDAGIKVVTVGSKANQFFKKIDVELTGHVSHLGDQPKVEDLLGVTKIMLDAFKEEKIDKLYICYNDFVNTMTQKATIEQLLPMEQSEDEEMRTNWDYLYEPDAVELLNDFLTRYIESLVYQAIVENVASEHAARMVAMKSASDNANNMIDELQLIFNKARQAAITQEISEIVSGAAAV